MPSFTEKALLELSSAFVEIDDYNHLPRIYQEILNKYLYFDWLSIFTWRDKFALDQTGGAFNISTHPHLPLNGDDLNQQIAAINSYAAEVMSLPPGQAIMIEAFQPITDSDRWVLEFCVKHGDTVYCMGMPTGNGPDPCSALGIYRTDPQKKFTEDEKRFFERLGPFLRSSIKMMAHNQHWDQVRAGHDRIFEIEDIQSLIVDLDGNVISYPPRTQTFFKSVLGTFILEDLPEFITEWMSEQIIPQYFSTNIFGPWHTIEQTRSGDITCRAELILQERKSAMLIITFRLQDRLKGFHALSRIGVTQREIETLSYLPLGYTNRQIAMAMGISVSGVKKHLRNLGRKLDTAGRSETLFRALTLQHE